MARLVKLRCKDCRKTFTVPSDVALQDLIEQGKVEGGHVWTEAFYGEKYQLRHTTREDRLEEQADKEICSVCGVPHGPNPYTGCEL